MSRVNAALERRIPEQRVFLKSDIGTRFIRLRPATIAALIGGGAVLMTWTIVVTAIFLMDAISSGNQREQAQRERAVYEARLNALSQERDNRAAEAMAARERFNVAMDEISTMQSMLLALEDRRNELETGIEVIQSTLRGTMRERDEARSQTAEMVAQLEADRAAEEPTILRARVMDRSVAALTSALEQAANERDAMVARAEEAQNLANDLQFEMEIAEDRNDQIFSRLEEAVTVSMEPLDKMFRAAGMETDDIISEVRRGYNGQGGPLIPSTMSTSGGKVVIDPTTERANKLLNDLEEINLFRIAAAKTPVTLPVRGRFNYTSGFGYRSDPFGRGRRMHSGTDFAGARGTTIVATADGVVTFAGTQSGYGKLVKIQHAFGLETRYAHLSAINVSVGERVSRGDKIGGMGATGRATGTHLHYEVRVNGNAVNPMTYIKAGRDVF